MFRACKCLCTLSLFVAISGALIGCPPQYDDAQIELTVSPTQLDFGSDVVTREIRITKNATAREMSPLSVTSLDAWIQPQSCTNGGSGCVSDGPLDPLDVTIRVDRSRMSLGANSGAVVVESPGAVAKTIEVYADALLVPDFSADKRSPQPGEVVKFTDLTQTAEGAVISREWDFGDGTKSTAQDPSHIFTEERAYQVSLKVSTANRTETAVRRDYIIVGGEGPVAEFTATPLTVFEGETVKFTDQSSSGLGQIKSWSWNFGDGGTSASASPYHTYNTPGKYTVSLTVANDYGSDTATKTNYVFVQSRVAPVAAFMYGAPYVNQFIQFTDLSLEGSKPITSWRWNFGDPGGLLNISTQRNPKYMYTAPGTYHVTLTVSSEHGTSSTQQDIRVDYAPLIADFTPSRTRALVNDAIVFTDTSLFGSLPIKTYQWDFGDGGTSSESHPSHKYTTPGAYTVKLTVSTEVESSTKTKVALINVFERRALDDFMRRTDINYHYELKRTLNLYGVTGYVILMTSQQWRTADEVNLPLWKHWVTLYVPPVITNSTALLMVSGGGNTSAQDGSPVPSSLDSMLAQTAIETGSVLVVLNQVPSERLKFSDEFDPRYLENGRSEDEIISYTYHRFFETYADHDPDETWPLLLPMVKSAVRAMDATQDFMKKQATPVTIDDFVVTGASKRGWTTWLTGAYDHRVRAIAPMVIDVLNMDAQMDHHRTSYGFYSDAIIDYVDLFIFEHFDSADGQALLKIVDPFEYRERLIMPKLIINSTGDEFFLPDSLQFYYNELLGTRHVSYQPNTNHGLGGYQNVVASLIPWYKGVVENRPLPELSWSAENTRIVIQTKTTPQQVLLWTAVSPTRDFRFNTEAQPNPPSWTSTPLAPSGLNRYIAEPTRSASAWTAFFVQFKFDSGMSVGGVSAPYIVCSECRVAPPTAAVGPKADFYATKVRAQRNEKIRFTDLTAAGTANVSSWEWDFGDGHTSTLRDPWHTYTESDSYTVSLTVRSLVGEDTMVKQNYITIEEPTGDQLVPDVVGMTVEEATELIESAGFEVGPITGEVSTEVEAGRIIRQEPQAGDLKPVGTLINLVKSTGSSTVQIVVPDIRGMTRTEAQDALIAAGLTVGNVTWDTSSTVEVNHVISQDPEYGEEVNEGWPVNFVLSRGAGVMDCIVPNVYNMTEAAAKAAIVAAHLTAVEPSETLASVEVEAGRVMMQSPEAGTVLTEGDPVTLTVSLGDQYTELDYYLQNRQRPPEYQEAAVVPVYSGTMYVLDLKSGDWLTPAEVDRTEWRHWLSIVVPAEVQSTTALLVVSGGGYDKPMPAHAEDEVELIASVTKSVVALLPQVPSEPLVFQDEPGVPHSEDEIIAYSFDKYIKTGDSRWPALFPMVRSAVAAMDAIQDYEPTSFVEDFIVTGASKRGWTTWLTGAVDTRVRAIVPMVIDVLNMDKQMDHQFKAYNTTPPLPSTYQGYSDEVHDYVDYNIFSRFEDPLGIALLGLVDPYEYQKRLYMPKLIINATGDQFFLPDSSQFYLHKIPGVSALRYVPNTDHGLGDASLDVVKSVATFFQGQIMGGSTPSYPWEYEGDTAIRVHPETSAQSARVWYANAMYERDFRLKTTDDEGRDIPGPVWKSQTLVRDNFGDYVGEVDYPTYGWTAFFVELTYKSPVPPTPVFGVTMEFPYVFTTPVRVIPDWMDYENPYPDGPYPFQYYRDLLQPHLATGVMTQVPGETGGMVWDWQAASQITFGPSTDSINIGLKLLNGSGRGASWQIDPASKPAWLNANFMSGKVPVNEESINEDEPVGIVVLSVNRGEVYWQSEPYTATLKFIVNGPQGFVPLNVTLEMPEPSVGVSCPAFSEDVLSGSVLLYSNVKMDFRIDPEAIPRWFRLDAPVTQSYIRGTIASGVPYRIQAHCDRTLQLPSWYIYQLPVTVSPWPDSFENTVYGSATMRVINPEIIWEPRQDNTTTECNLAFGASVTERSCRFWSDHENEHLHEGPFNIFHKCDMWWRLEGEMPPGITIENLDTSGDVLYTSNGGPGSVEAYLTADSPLVGKGAPYHGYEYKTLTFKLDREQLDWGYYSRTLQVVSAGGNFNINLSYDVSCPFPEIPDLNFEPDLVTIPADETEITTGLFNKGCNELSWYLDQTSNVPPWLSFSQMAGTLKGARRGSITLTVNRANTYWKQGGQAAAVVFHTNGDPADRTLLVSMLMSAPQAEVEGYDFGNNNVAGTVTVRNTGDCKFDYELMTAQLPTWLIVLGSTKGTLAAGAEAQIAVLCERTGLDPATYSYQLPIQLSPWPGGSQTLNALMAMGVTAP